VEHVRTHMLYFDHNATGPLCAAARDAWLDAQTRFAANPSSLHRPGQRASAALDASRATLAAGLGCDEASLVWTSGATEAAATVFGHLAQQAEHRAEVWVSAVEHPCVLESAERFFPGRVRLLPVSEAGLLELEVLKKMFEKSLPAAVALMAASNETGVLQPWDVVQSLCRDAGVPFVCDATQWIGRLPAGRLGACDFLFGSGHKCGGPVGTGFLSMGAAPFKVRPLLRGGPQEEGRRAGTQNVAGAAAFAAALADCTNRFREIPERLGWRIRFEERLSRALPDLRILGAGKERLWNTVAFLPPDLADCRQRWVIRLDAAGVAASSGSACASGQEKPSHVLRAMGVEAAAADRVLRLSAGWETDWTEWEEVAHRIETIYKRLGPAAASKQA
jgi:cysteine desulfurase